MWRPEGWKNPYSTMQIKRLDPATLCCEMMDGTCYDNLIREAREHTFEAGADAILKSLLEHSVLTYTQFMFEGKNLGAGIVCFIPDEETDS